MSGAVPSPLPGAVALVTGAGRGLGQAVALALGAAGTRVAVVDVNPDSAQRTVDTIQQAGGQARAALADVSNKMAVQTMLYDVLEAWERIDLLVNAAHVSPSGTALKLDEWEWNRTLDVNLKGTFLVSQTVARAMQATGGGLILNVIRPAAASSHPAVRAARAGLLGLTQALAEEWGDFGISVQLIEAETAVESVLSSWRKSNNLTP
jgi:NAD(P)-dependent dehydrogenase (short-subunit alcohol dehydrogenase family)